MLVYLIVQFGHKSKSSEWHLTVDYHNLRAVVSSSWYRLPKIAKVIDAPSEQLQVPCIHCSWLVGPGHYLLQQPPGCSFPLPSEGHNVRLPGHLQGASAAPPSHSPCGRDLNLAQLSPGAQVWLPTDNILALGHSFDTHSGHINIQKGVDEKEWATDTHKVQVHGHLSKISWHYLISQGAFHSRGRQKTAVDPLSTVNINNPSVF